MMEPKYMTLMNETGYPVKLPEWVGFWFLIGTQVYVMTKDGDILNTPDLEQYGGREDWQIVDLGNEIEITALFVKALRIRTDECLQRIKRLPASREASLAITDTQRGFMKMGKLLGEIGAPNPYPESRNPGSPVIEKHQDLWDGKKSNLFTAFDSLDNITAFVKGLRLEMSTTISMLYWLLNNTSYERILPAIDAIDDATLWLGQVLNNIRVQDEANEKFKTLAASMLYHVYGHTTGFKNFKGDPMPQWEALPETQRNAWLAVGKSFLENGGQLPMMAQGAAPAK